MPAVSRTFRVDPAPQAVIGYLADFGHAEQWDPGTVSCTRTGTGPVSVGSSWHNVSRFAGLTTELDYALQQLTSDTIVFVGRNKGATSTDTITVLPDGNGSKVTYRADLQLHGATPSATLLTVMPLRPTSRASARVNPAAPALAAA